jgi:hypothetical protein
MAVVRVRGRGYRRKRWVNETAATIEQGGVMLATSWCAKVFRGALKAGASWEQRWEGKRACESH